MIREEIAKKIIVDCGYGTEYPCPHTPEGNPLGTNEMCQHEDNEICIWQLEQAAQIIPLIKSEIEGMKNPYDKIQMTYNEQQLKYAFEKFRELFIIKLEE